MKITKRASTITLIMVLMMTSTFGSLSTVNSKPTQVIPVHEVEVTKQIFKPTPLGDLDYYILEPRTAFSAVNYERMISGSTSYTYSQVTGSRLTEATATVNPGAISSTSPLVSSMTSNNIRENPHPLFPDDYLPRAIQLTPPTLFEHQFEQTINAPFSLHMDHSLTFLAKGNEFYYALIKTDGPFLLDVSLSTQGVNAYIQFTNASYDADFLGYDLLSCVTPQGQLGIKRTLAVYPVSANDTTTSVVIASITVSQDTLVTLSPHPFNSLPAPIEVPVNHTYLFDVKQGSIVEQNGKEYDYKVPSEENQIFSVTHFTFSLEAGNYYRISYPLTRNLLTENGINMNEIEWMNCPEDGWFFKEKPNEEWTIVQSLSNEVIVQAMANTTITLVNSIYGFWWNGYDITFQKVNPADFGIGTAGFLSSELPLNQPIDEMFTEVYYNFTLTQPVLMAINRTGGGNNDPRLDFYRWNEDTVTMQGTWEFISTLRGNSNFLRITAGNIYGAGAISSADWWYLPEGTYAINPTTFGNNVVVQFNVVPLLNPFGDAALSSSANTTLNLTRDDVVAVKIPRGLTNHVQWINITTSDVNQSVSHEYVFLSMWGENLIMDNTYTTSGTVEIGDETYGNDNSSTGISNRTRLLQYLPVTENTEMILLIHPYQATNRTDSGNPSVLANFTTSLAIHVGPINDSLYPTINQDFGPVGSTFDGTFVPHDIVTTPSRVNYAINDDLTDSRNQVHGIPFSVEPFALYNVTIHAIGNDTNSLNVTINDVTITGGNLTDLMVFGDFIISSNATHETASALILSVSDTLHLYLDLTRNGRRNATLLISIQKLPVEKMNFDLYPIQVQWDETILPEEQLRNKPLLQRVSALKGSSEITTKPEQGGFDPIGAGLLTLGFLALIGGVIGTIVIIRKRHG